MGSNNDLSCWENTWFLRNRKSSPHQISPFYKRCVRNWILSCFCCLIHITCLFPHHQSVPHRPAPMMLNPRPSSADLNYCHLNRSPFPFLLLFLKKISFFFLFLHYLFFFTTSQWGFPFNKCFFFVSPTIVFWSNLHIFTSHFILLLFVRMIMIYAYFNVEIFISIRQSYKYSVGLKLTIKVLHFKEHLSLPASFIPI